MPSGHGGGQARPASGKVRRAARRCDGRGKRRANWARPDDSESLGHDEVGQNIEVVLRMMMKRIGNHDPETLVSETMAMQVSPITLVIHVVLHRIG